jgi:formylmethanofuran dehydrogenase subunit E
MRFPILREADGSAAMGECDLCGAELWRGGAYYRVNGETVCPDCLTDYARRVFAPFLRRMGEEDL